MSTSSPSRRKCRYRQPPHGFNHSPLKGSDDSINSRFSVRSTSTASAAWSIMKSSMKKRRFSGFRKQPSASFADAVAPPDDSFDDGASIATDNAASAPLLGVAASSPPRKTRSSFKSPSSFKLKSSEKTSFKIGKHKSERSEASAAASRRKKWKTSVKNGKISSKINLASHSRSYESFASSRGNPSPPPEHVEKLGPVPQKFMEYTFDFDACFFQEPLNHSLMSEEEHFLRRSTTSSETPPPPPPPPIEPFFVPAFYPFPTLHEAMDDASLESNNNETEENRNLSDSEHLLSASQGIKFFESLSPTSLTVHSSSSFKSSNCEAVEQNGDIDACSCTSMPSINENDCVPSMDDVVQHDSNIEPELVNAQDASDSVIAWTLLGAVMGSPAPQSILKAKKKKDCANLWIDEANDSCDDNHELPAIDNDESVGEASMPDINIIFPPVEKVADDTISIPDEFGDSLVVEDSAIDEDATSNTLAWSALAIFLGSPAPSCIQQKQANVKPKNLWAESSIDENDELVSLATSEINEVDDDCLPILDENDDVADDIRIPGFGSDPDNAFPQKSNKDAADSAIMWTALSAILASPAPSCVRPTKHKFHTYSNLWGDCDDDLISLETSVSIVDESERITPESPVSPVHNDEDSIGDIDLSLSALQLESDSTCEHIHTDAAAPKTTEEIANSTLAWGALTALLGLPAPSCVVSKNSRSNKNLWSNGDDDDLLSLDNSEADIASVPSLVADSQFDSAPSSPLIKDTSSFDVPSPERDNAVIQTYIEW